MASSPAPHCPRLHQRVAAPSHRPTWKPSSRTKLDRSQAVQRARASATRACAARRTSPEAAADPALVQGLQLEPSQPECLEEAVGEASNSTLVWWRRLAPSTAGSSSSASSSSSAASASCSGEAAAVGEPKAAPAGAASAPAPAPGCWQPAIICSHTPWLCWRRSASWARVARISSRHDCTSLLRSAGVPGSVEAADACGAREGHGLRDVMVVPRRACTEYLPPAPRPRLTGRSPLVPNAARARPSAAAAAASWARSSS